MNRKSLLLSAFLFGAFIAPNAFAQTPPKPSYNDYFFKGANYDPLIPSPKNVLGYEIGEKISSYDEILKYFETLARTLPTRVKLIDYGKSWQGRRLYYVVIGTPVQIQNLETIKANSRALASGNLDPMKRSAIIKSQPNIVWIANSVHGNELSPSDSAILSAYHLLAAKNDVRLEKIRANTLNIIVPLQNPDGRQRFINSNAAAIGKAPDADEWAIERDEAWPSGRPNHYNFDLNRDWLTATQPETQGHIKAVLDFYPQVLIDAHEMQRDQTYFFPPEADPINPLHSEKQKELRQLIGRGNAKAFDRAGINYFTRDIFDGFYPGYGDGWPTTQGIIAMTYEQASSRGLIAIGKDGSILEYKTTIRNHFTANMASIDTAATAREKFLESFYEFRQSAINDGKGKYYIINPENDPSLALDLVKTLSKMGIESKTANNIKACGKTYESAYIISMAQPSSRLIKNLLEREIPLPEAFIKKQEELRKNGKDDEIYDVTAWSLPLMYNLETDYCETTEVLNGQKINLNTKLAAQSLNNNIGYIIPINDAGNRALVFEALNNGFNLKSMNKPFTKDGKNYAAGTIIALKADNTNYDKFNSLVKSNNALPIPIIDTWVTDGPNFGADDALKIKNPKIALLWDSPTNPNAAGSMRFILEQRFGANLTIIRPNRLRSGLIAKFDVIIIPDGNNYQSIIGNDGVNNLKAYLNNGGSIIGFGGALRFLSDENSQIIPIEAEKPQNAKPQPKDNFNNIDELNQSTIAAQRNFTPIDGAILKLQTNEEHWVNFSIPKHLYSFYEGADIYKPINSANGANPIVYAGANEIRASGILWDANLNQMAFKPFVIVANKGRGFAIGVNSSLSFRAQNRGLEPLLFNMLIGAPTRANPLK